MTTMAELVTGVCVSHQSRIQDPHTARIKLVHNGATQPHIFSIKHCVFTLSEQTKTFLVFITVLHHRCWFQGHGVSPNLTLGEGFFFSLTT